MNGFEKMTDAISDSFTDLWAQAISFLPTVIGAIIIILVGSIVAKGVSTLVRNVLKDIWDKRLKNPSIRSVFGAEEAIERGGIKVNVPSTVGTIIYWFLMIVFLMAATEILNLTQVTGFLNSVLLYLPNVLVGVLILLLGIVFSSLVETLVRNSVKATNLTSANFLAGIAKWSVLIFAIMAGLVQLKVAAELISVLFTGFIAMIAIAGGLAFGLGGKDHAKQMLDEIRKDIQKS